MSRHAEQARAAKVLAELAAIETLPYVCTWQADDGRVRGQLGLREVDETERDALTVTDLHDWAVFLGDADGPPHIHRRTYNHHPTSTRVWVETRRHGVPVEIWNAVRTPATTAAVAAS